MEILLKLSVVGEEVRIEVVNPHQEGTTTAVVVPRTRGDRITPREREILKLIAEGKSAKEIATVLNLSVKTVEAHKFNLMRKLGIHKKALLVHYAAVNGIVPFPGVPMYQAS